MSTWPRLSRDFDRLRGIKGWGPTRTLIDVLLFDAGFQAVWLHRIGSTFKRWGVPVVSALCRRLAVGFCGVDILPQSQIAGGLYLPHPIGIVIGGATVIGEDCTLLQGVTLGEADFAGTACPRLGDRVTIGAGAKVLGAIEVGDDSFVGAGAVVLDDVPPRSIAVGVPARARPITPRETAAQSGSS